MARTIDLAPSGPLALPVTGLGEGWEPKVLMTLTLVLLSMGLVTLYSATNILAQRQELPDYFYVVRQAIGAGVGLTALGLCAWLPHHVWKHLAWPMIAVVWILLVIVVLPNTEEIAPRINSARRWIQYRGVTIQPSELAKVAVIVWTAALAVKKQEYFTSLRRGLGPFLLVWGAVVITIAVEPDLSTAVLVGLLGCTVVFAAGGRVAHFVLLGFLATPVLYKQLDAPFRAERVKAFIQAFLDPSVGPVGAGYQVYQSLLAFGSGGIVGRGFGQGRQKLGFLPEAHTDFIFAMIGEEWGLVGVSVIVLLYMLLILIGFRVAARAPDLFGKLLAVGITSMIAMQTILHMSVGLGLFLPTGLPLPLMSFGRSSLLVTMASLGILISIARASRRRSYVGRRARA